MFILIPSGHAAAGLHGDGNGSGKAISELLDDVGFGEAFVDVALLVGPGGEGLVGGRILLSEKIAFAGSQIRRVACHHVLKSRGKRQDFVLDFNGVGGILREVFRLSHHDRNYFSLKVQFQRKRFGHGAESGSEVVGISVHRA